MQIIGCDPGLRGGLAVFERHELKAAIDVPLIGTNKKSEVNGAAVELL